MQLTKPEFKTQTKINQLIYLFLLKEIGNNEYKFNDSLVQVYKLLRFNTDYKFDKTLVSVDYSIIDPDRKQIVEGLLFYELIYSDLSLTNAGEHYLQQSLLNNEQLERVLNTFKNKHLHKTGYEDTCLSPTTPTASNCGICKELSCSKKTNVFTVFSKLIRKPQHQESNHLKSYSNI